MSPTDQTLLYLSRDDVRSAMPSPIEMIAAVERVFAQHAAGKVTVGAKARVPVRIGHFFQAMPGTLDAPPLAGMKWFGVVPENPARGLPNVSGLMILSDIATAQPVAVLDGNVITGIRTAAMSAAAAKRLAPPDATRIAFIGCGTQARSHATYLRAVLPNLRHATLVGRGSASRDSFAAELRAADWEVRIASDPNATIADAHVVVTTVPESVGFHPFLGAGRLLPGAFVVAVDLGRTWLPAGFRHFGIVATDDAEQSAHLVVEGRLNAPEHFDTDLARLVSSDTRPVRASATRALFVFAGHVLGDLAAAAAVRERARNSSIGTRLPL